MRYISLSNSTLSYFIAKNRLSELAGSSKYNVFDSEIVKKPKQSILRIENKTACQDYASFLLTANMSQSVLMRMLTNYDYLMLKCKKEKYTSEKDLTRLELLKKYISLSSQLDSDLPIKYQLIKQNITQQNSRYQRPDRTKKTMKTINKSKVKGKMFALFNLRASKKFMAFYSISFPANTSDDCAFECWNSFLTSCRKRCNLTNYVWVTERQKNGIIHYHMLSNNWLPIQLINKMMATIIDNKVKSGTMSWGKSSISRYNGVDVDSIFNSKRHKKTGKSLNPSQVRQWISSYVTKYVTKSSEKFKHLCWHCSRSISQLFTSTIFLFEERFEIINSLPALPHLYRKLQSEFNTTFVFCFVPPDKIFVKIKAYNDYISDKYRPIRLFKLNTILNKC